MDVSERLKEGRVLLRDAYFALNGNLFDKSLTQRIHKYLNACEPHKGPIYVPDAWEIEAEKYHKRECAKCQKVVYCKLCGDPISVGVCENCVPEIIAENSKGKKS